MCMCMCMCTQIHMCMCMCSFVYSLYSKSVQLPGRKETDLCPTSPKAFKSCKVRTCDEKLCNDCDKSEVDWLLCGILLAYWLLCGILLVSSLASHGDSTRQLISFSSGFYLLAYWLLCGILLVSSLAHQRDSTRQLNNSIASHQSHGDSTRKLIKISRLFFLASTLHQRFVNASSTIRERDDFFLFFWVFKLIMDMIELN